MIFESLIEVLYLKQKKCQEIVIQFGSCLGKLHFFLVNTTENPRHSANVLSAESTDECLRTKSKKQQTVILTDYNF